MLQKFIHTLKLTPNSISTLIQDKTFIERVIIATFSKTKGASVNKFYNKQENGYFVSITKKVAFLPTIKVEFDVNVISDAVRLHKFVIRSLSHPVGSISIKLELLLDSIDTSSTKMYAQSETQLTGGFKYGVAKNTIAGIGNTMFNELVAQLNHNVQA